jgi:hypothetical protein
MARTKEQRAADMRKYRRTHREHYLKLKRASYKRNRAKRLAEAKAYAAKYPDRIKARSVAYYKRAGRANARRWREKHPPTEEQKAKSRERCLAYHAANRERQNAKMTARYRATHPNARPRPPKMSNEARKERQRVSNKTYHDIHRGELTEKARTKRRLAGIGPAHRREDPALIARTGQKTCTRCDDKRPVGSFSKDRHSKDGLNNWCKPCVKRWNAENKEIYAQRYQRLKAVLSVKNRERYEKNWMQRREQGKRYYREHLEKYMEGARRRRLRQAGLAGGHSEAEWRQLCIRFNDRCVCCGIHKSIKKLTRDHVVPITHPLSSDAISNIQPLCTSCNCRKNAFHATDYRQTPFTGRGQAVLFG